MKDKAIIMDIDGVLADSQEYIDKYLRNVKEKDYDSFWNSVPKHEVFDWSRNLVENYHNVGHKIVMLTARQDIPIARENTLKWFYKNNIHCDMLLMQPPRDVEEKNELYRHGLIKIDMYNKLIKPHYDIEFMVDDSPDNVKMFREIGLTVLQPNNKWDLK